MSRAFRAALSRIWKETEGDVMSARGGRRRKLSTKEPGVVDPRVRDGIHMLAESRQAWLGHRRVLLRGNGCLILSYEGGDDVLEVPNQENI